MCFLIATQSSYAFWLILKTKEKAFVCLEIGKERWFGQIREWVS